MLKMTILESDVSQVMLEHLRIIRDTMINQIKKDFENQQENLEILKIIQKRNNIRVL